MLYPNKIEKSTISTLPPCDITGEIIIIDRPEDVAAAVDDLKQCSLIGFDTETLHEAIRMSVPEKFLELNMKAFELGAAHNV